MPSSPATKASMPTSKRTIESAAFQALQRRDGLLQIERYANFHDIIQSGTRV